MKRSFATVRARLGCLLRIHTLWCLQRMLVLAMAVTGSSFAGTVTYVYDEADRVVGAVDSSGQAVQYGYDNAGNLLAITRYGAATVTVLEFTPNAGAAGDTVTITGSGFSTSPSQNTVTFNGLVATVLTASATQVAVRVPMGVTTGPVSVTAPGGTATSATNFVVAQSNGAPTISGFTPDTGSPGTSVTVTGTNFDTNPGATKVRFNQTLAGISSITSTSLVTTVPNGATSGRIQITTVAGVASSAADFIVPPPGINAADIISKARITVGGASASLNINAQNKAGLLLFDGNAGQYLTVQLASFTTNPAGSNVAYELYSPRGLKIAAGYVSASQLSIHLPQLPATGTYSLYFKPGTATAAFSAVLVANKAILVDGVTLSDSVAISGQSTRFVFTGTAGQNLGLGISGLSLSTSYAQVNVFRPDGTSLTGVACYVSTGGCGLNLANLPVSGTYSVVVTPYNGGTGSFTATLSSDVTGALTAGTAYNLSLARAGQNGRLSFSGTAGGSVGIEVAGLATTPASQSVTITVYKPDGTTLSATTASGTGGFLNLSNLPATGTYTVFIDPANQSTASMKVTLDPGVALAIDGASATVNLTTAGETGRLTFTGTAGQNLGLGISGLTLAPAASTFAYVYVYKPDGTQVTGGYAACYVSTGGCGLNLPNLPVSGTYSVVVTPYLGGTGSFTATLSSDVTGALTAGTAYNLSLARAGQNGRLSFSGTAGDQRGLTLSSVAITGSTGSVTATVYKPDGTYLTSVSAANGATGIVDLPVLPTTGTYTVFIDPPDKATASLNVLLTADVSVALALDGAASNVSITQTGQTARLTFTGTAGQNLGLGISGLTLAPTTSTFAYVYVYKPDGTQLTGGYVACYVSTGGCGLNLGNLPVSGTYSVVVTPYLGGTGSFTATLSSDVTGALTAGTAYNLNLARAGQNGRLSFSGTAGDQRGLTLSGVTITGSTGSVTATIYKPDGTYLTTISAANGATAIIDLPVLPTTGTYTVFIDPPDKATASLNVLLTADVSVALALDGAASNVSITQTGQTARLTFTGTAGQNLGLGISGLSLSTSYAQVNVFKPDGTSLTGVACYVSTGGCGLNLANLPVSGTYSVVVTPYNGGTGSFTATLSSDVTGALTAGTAYNLSLARAGQNGRLSFSGTAGTNRTLSFTGISTVPTGKTVSFMVYQPNGSYWTGTSTATATGSLPLTSLPATGTYTLFVEAADYATAAATINLSP